MSKSIQTKFNSCNIKVPQRKDMYSEPFRLILRPLINTSKGSRNNSAHFMNSSHLSKTKGQRNINISLNNFSSHVLVIKLSM
jgi:hypothetical protein